MIADLQRVETVAVFIAQRAFRHGCLDALLFLEAALKLGVPVGLLDDGEFRFQPFRVDPLLSSTCPA